MGRSSAGGHSGGGRSSGGSHGGSSRSFGGGRSSSTRSSYSSSPHVSSSSHRSSSHTFYSRPSYSHGPSMNRTTIYNTNYGMGPVYGGSYPVSGYAAAARRRSTIITCCFMCICLICLILLMAALFSGGGVQASTIEREKLEANLCTPINNEIVDLAEWGIDTSQVKKATSYFYKKTGVQPIIVASEGLYGSRNPTDADIESAIMDIYDERVNDEGHAVFWYMDFGGGDWGLWWVVGNQARTVLDDEACSIVQDYFTRYAESDLSDPAYFSTCLTKAADRIMTKSTPKWVYITMIMAFGVTAFIVVVIVNFALKRKELKIKEMEEASKILNTDI